MAAASLFPTLCIRADAGASIGLGHVMRCLALAQAWQDAGGRVVMITQNENPALLQRLAAENIIVRPLQSTPATLADAEETARVAHQEDSEWVVLDGYHFTAAYRTAIKSQGFKLLVLDDQANADLSQADFILNQNAYASPELYPLALKPELLLGSRYVLLRREFVTIGTELAPPIPERASRVMILLGGSDPANATLRVMTAFADVSQPRLQLTIVAGAANPHIESLRAALPLLKKCHDAELQVNPDELPQLMAAAHVVVSAAGSTCWEIAYLGIPMAVLITAENQRQVAASLEAHGIAIQLGDQDEFPKPDSVSLLNDLLNDGPRRSQMSRKARSLIDGHGARRVAERIACHPIRLRAATPEDAALLHEWANDAEARRMSFSTSSIPWADHQTWLERKLAAPDCRLSIAVNDVGAPAGQVRLDREEAVATLSLSIAPGCRGQGLASKVARLAAAEAVGEGWCREVQAWVKPENTASLQTFRRSGFHEWGPQAAHSQEAILFTWDIPKDRAATI